MGWLFVTLPFSITGIWLCYKFAANVFSPVFLAVLFWFFAYIGGMEYGIAIEHYATPLTISLGILFFGVGVSTASIYEKFSPHRELMAFRKSSFVERFGKCVKMFYISLLVNTVIMIFLASLLFYLGDSPLLMGTTREIARAGFATNKGLYARAFTISLPIIAGILLCLRHKVQRRLFTWAFFVVTLALIIGLVLWMSRGGILNILLFFLITVGLIREPNKKNVTVFLIVLGIAFASSVILNSYFYQDTFITSLQIIFKRITVGQAEGMDHIIYNWVPQKGLGFGEILAWDIRGLLAFLRIVPYPEGSFGVQIFWDVHPETYPYTFSMVTILLGDLYADYGITGVMVGAWLFGLLLEILYIRTLRGVKDVFLLPVKIYILDTIAHVAIGSGLFSVAATNVITSLLTILLIFLVYSILSLPFGIIWRRYVGNKIHKRCNYESAYMS